MNKRITTQNSIKHTLESYCQEMSTVNVCIRGSDTAQKIMKTLDRSKTINENS